MANIAFISPSQQLSHEAEKIAAEHNLPLALNEVYSTGYTDNESAEYYKNLVRGGIDMFIARGFQAQIISSAVDVPVIEIHITAEELGILIRQGRSMLNDENALIAAVCSYNMLSSTAKLDSLIDANVKRYITYNYADGVSAVNQALKDGAKLIIGGVANCAYAQQYDGIKTLTISTGKESLEESFRIAKWVATAVDTQKQSYTEIRALLDSSISGVLELANDGTILLANTPVSELLNKRSDEILGKSIFEFLEKNSGEMLRSAIESKAEAHFAVLLPQTKKELTINVSPLDNGKKSIMTIHAGTQIHEMETELRRELLSRGYVARSSFDMLISKSQAMLEIISEAKRLAQFSTMPMLITAPQGCPREILAQCIHNYSTLKDNGFVYIDCGAWTQPHINELLFGSADKTGEYSSRCLAELAENGTLFVDNIDKLSLELQYKIYCLITHRLFLNGENRPMHTQMRIIAGTSKPLSPLVDSGAFRSDLFGMLSISSIEMPPLCKRPADIEALVLSNIEQLSSELRRPMHITNGALSCLTKYLWAGNEEQLNAFCRRLAVMTKHRNIDEGFVRIQLNLMYPWMYKGDEDEHIVIMRDEKMLQIAEMLKKHSGRREEVAAELGMSKTTLWRCMKKYGLTNDIWKEKL